MKLQTQTHSRSTRPAGFSLVELLVVLAIIGVLIALTAAAVTSAVSTQRTSNTEAAISKIQQALRRQWMAVIDSARKEAIPPAVLATAGGDPNRARVIYVKLRLKQEFPQSFAEAINPSPMPAKPGYVRYLSGASATTPASEQSAICLFMILQQSRGGEAFNADESIGSAGIGTIGAHKVFRDGWENPIVYQRWLTADLVNFPAGPAGSDPEDPEGLLAAASWQANSGLLAQFVAWCHALPGPGQAQALRPVVRSAGPNETLNDNDDLTSIHLKFGGRGDK